jgi:hypothetical protein
MSISDDKKHVMERPAPDIPIEDCIRSRQEGAFVSPCGTEGCQWDGFPEPPDDLMGEMDDESGQPADARESD